VSEQNLENAAPILLIDDSPENVRLITAVLRGAGLAVRVATDGDVGAALIVSQKWGFAIVDLVLPGLDGVEVIQAGRAADPDLPIAIFSVSSNAGLIDAAFRAGADFQLSKPIEPPELLARLKEFSKVPSTQVLSRPKTSPSFVDAPREKVPAEPVETRRRPTVLAVGACPGDVEMGCGGVLSKHRAEGHRIVIVNLAGGGDPTSPVAASANLAADLLEAQMENMGLETPHIVDVDAATLAIKKLLDTYTPGIVYLPSASSGRPCSAEGHQIAMALATAVPNVLAYQDPGATVDFRPKFFVDLAPYIKPKMELVAVYDRLGLKNVGTGMAKATAFFWGRFAEHTLVEPLEVIRQRSA
jgi:CheY-like chemotaxis protein/LmbE family N-acetylglucosaminyl deacetylase